MHLPNEIKKKKTHALNYMLGNLSAFLLLAFMESIYGTEMFYISKP